MSIQRHSKYIVSTNSIVIKNACHTYDRNTSYITIILTKSGFTERRMSLLLFYFNCLKVNARELFQSGFLFQKKKR